jgi:DNA-binding CsgD family transcriptional regulator
VQGIAGRAATHGLLEREYELHTLSEVIAGAPSARASGADGTLVVIEGAAGEGKTVLLDRVRANAAEAEVVIVDDAHLLSAVELDGLVDDCRRGATVIAALRPGEPRADEVALDRLRVSPGALRLGLRPLSAESVATVVRARLPGAEDALARQVHHVTAGNPLYVTELLAGDPGRTKVVAVGDRIMRRAAEISDEAPAFTLALAVVGEHERLGVAARVAGITPELAEQIAHRLRRMQILSSEDPYAFAQPLVPASIQSAVSDARRASAHLAAARELTADGRGAVDVARHLSAQPPSGSDDITAGLLAAAEAAADGTERVRWLRRALAENSPNPGRAELLARLGSAEAGTRDAAAIDHLREALELTRAPGPRSRLALQLAEILAHAGQWEQALAAMDVAETGTNAESEELRVNLTALAATASAYDPDRVAIFDRLRPSLSDLARGEGWSARAVSTLLASVAAQRGEPVDTVVEWAESAMRDGVLLREHEVGGWATPQLLIALILSEQLDRALEVCAQADIEARAAGSPYGRLVAGGYRGWALLRLGDLAAAEAACRETWAMRPDPPMGMIDATLYHSFADALVERPGLADVAAEVSKVELDPAFMRTWSGAMLMWARGLLALAAHDRERAIAELRGAAAIASGLRFGPSALPWRSQLALAIEPEAHEDAEALIATELELARAHGLARPLGIALRAAGLVAAGDRGVALIRESAAVLEGSPARLEHARTLIALGAALRRARRVAEARGPLEAGLELALDCGAVRLSARARGELGAAAGRPPRHQSPEVVFTAGELRVARLAARGVSNRDVAAELFLSPKTVETHLSRVYRKLGLTGRGARAQLGRAIAAYEPPGTQQG